MIQVEISGISYESSKIFMHFQACVYPAEAYGQLLVIRDIDTLISHNYMYKDDGGLKLASN